MKQKKIFTCQNCGSQSPKWVGKCLDCGQWNTMVEETYTANSAPLQGMAAVKANVSSGNTIDSAYSRPMPIEDIIVSQEDRYPSQLPEFDRVLGGGIVPGSLILIGGDPGIGKSTVLMQALAPQKGTNRKVLYVSGEESPAQIKLRAARLGVNSGQFLIFTENRFEAIFDQVKNIKPDILIIDSIQTVYSDTIQSAPGSVSQIRECTAKIMALAKTLNVSTFIVGHITKDGSIAGPKVLEHMVDTVLYFENSNSNPFRILRTVKNRFGSTNEIGVFEMLENGLSEVKNPSEIFLQERPVQVAGSTVISAIEGSRTILVEVQALVSSTNFGVPRRTSIGFDHNKVSLLVAVIEKKLGMPLYGHDIFVNIAGGISLREPAADLGVVLALISSFRNQPLENQLLIVGEVGLTGEVRHVSQLELRLAEARKLGFTKVIAPLSSIEKGRIKTDGIKIIGVKNLEQAVMAAFE